MGKKQHVDPCQAHPSYTGQRTPRTSCEDCWKFYNWNKEHAATIKATKPSVAPEMPAPAPPPPPPRKPRKQRTPKAKPPRVYKLDGEGFQKLAKNLARFKVTEPQLERYFSRYGSIIGYIVDRCSAVYSGLGERLIVELTAVLLDSLELSGELPNETSTEDEKGTIT